MGDDVHVGLSAHVEHHVVVCRVVVVAVSVPVARLVVYLHVAHPQGAVHLHLRVEEVGSGVAVVQAGVEHLHSSVVGGLQVSQGEQLVLPAVVQQCFHCP